MASRSGSSVSSCQTGTASASTAASAHNASRSSCDPGYVTTPIRGCGLAMDLHLVRLHQRVCEKLLAHLLDLRTRIVGARRIDLDVHNLADAGARHREAEVLERRVHRLALRVEDPLLGADEDGRPHPSTTRGSSRYAGKGI